MIRGLLEKELRQHATLILFMLILLTTGLMMMQGTGLLARSGGSAFATLAWLLLVFLPLTCVILGNALIAGEFRHRTQIFLEGLPMPRWMMLAVKYALGLILLFSVVSALLASAWWSTRGGEAMTDRFVCLLWVKALGWTWFCWAVCYALAFLGRYRLLIGVVIFGGLLYAQNGAGVMVNRFGPFDLIGSRFAYERFVWPVEALWITAALIVSITGFGFALGLVRDATLASMLSEKMSAREKMTVTALAIVSLMIIGSVFEKKQSTDPLHLPGAVDVSLRAATISTAAAVSVPTEEEKAALKAHAQASAEMLASAADYLGCSKLPPLFIVHRRDLTTGELEDGDLDSRQGYLLRLNMLTTPPTDPVLQSRVLNRVLSVHQHYRLKSDNRGWVLDGFAAWWPLREKATTAQQFTQSRKPTGKREPITISRHDLQHWLKFKEDLDEEAAATVAGIGVLTLGKSDTVNRQQFLSAVLGYAAPHDFRAALHDAMNSVPTLLRVSTGLDLDTLAQQWTAALHDQEVQP